MKKYEKIELNEREYLMVTDEDNVIEVVVDIFSEAFITACKLIYKMVVKHK